jgi:MFS family permease
MKKREMRPSGAQLQSLRCVFLSLIVGLWLCGLVLLLIPEGHERQLLPTSLGVAAFGVLSAAYVHLLASRPLAGADSAGVATKYVTIFFIQIGLAEAAALAGFVATFLAGSRVPYAVGLAFSMVGFFELAPSKRNIARRQEQLDAQGVPVNLLRALLGPWPSK